MTNHPLLRQTPRVGTLLPQVEWWGWLILLLIVVLLAVLEGAYHMSQRVNNISKEFLFEFNDSSITTKDGRLILGVTYTTHNRMTVETLQVEYNSKRFRPIDWVPLEIQMAHTQNYTFDLTALKEVANESSQEGVFVAKITGIEYRSKPFNIYKQA